MSRAELAVALRGVTRRFEQGDRTHTVLRNVECDIAGGEFVALRGPSGSGKSTLLNLVAGIDLPDAGRVQVAGRVINELSDRERTLLRRRHIGFVFQFFNLIPTLTVLENVSLPLELNGLTAARAAGRARDLLAQVQLADRERTFPDRLSGGEQQRVAIARAIAPGPRLLLADEPTGNLDHETGDRILGLLLSLVRQRGTTLVLATHSHQIAARAQRTLLLRDGSLRQEA